MFATEVLPSDPSWLDDHRVFGRVIMPGALYGAVAAAAMRAEGAAALEVADLQLHSPMVFPETTPRTRRRGACRRCSARPAPAAGDGSRFSAAARPRTAGRCTPRAPRRRAPGRAGVPAAVTSTP